MRVLVTYGSKRGGTEGLARTLAKALAEAGLTVDIAPASRHLDPTGADAVVIGGALYANRWHKDARRFVSRHKGTLRERSTWLFSSGPLDDSAAKDDIPPTRQVERLMSQIGAEGHCTFGGRLATDARGFPAAAMVRNGQAGDWRDEDHIGRWAREIAAALRQQMSGSVAG